ncbi:MAG: DNA polymerase I [Candidatus Magasanikbacteria bacterium RIFOXYC2_FULL_42_28]|uniref:DNA polymerase I n=1 Tax=Candidatus Magasanikbacteria bacterium RIFOXYC2_FULL_42_28 TaxID=1798704 RepID=A0A1F6NVA6_9BACT|nr:MAG: DNA polymerase I [Candidatus Magasanikbacteria bacterium RIFOXYC2_FULL_42_28]
MKKLVIIDGNAIIHRAYHAIPPMNTKNGMMVNAVYGFTSMLLRVWKDLKPTHIAVTFDMRGPTFRHEKFKEYKATRVKADQELYDQIPLVHNVVRAFNIPIYEKAGYEADDVIGTVARMVENKKEVETYIVTGDKDTLQLIEPGVKVFTLRKGMSDTVIYDAEGVKEKFGFLPDKMVDYKALAGDASDNIPGVPGVGEKTATDLIQKFGGIDEIYDNIKNQKSNIKDIKAGVLKKLIDGEESARMSFELATIDRNVPGVDFKLEDCVAKEFDREKVVKIFQELEFMSLLKRLPGEALAKTGLPGASGDGDPSLDTRDDKQKKVRAKFKVDEIKTKDEVEKLVEQIRKTKSFACREATAGREVYNSELFGVAVIVSGAGYFISEKLLKEFLPVFEFSDCEFVGHDLKQLIKILKLQGVEIKNKLFDTMIASYLLEPGSRAHDSASIVLKVLGQELPAGAGQNSLFGADMLAVTQELYQLSLAAEKLKKELVAISDFGLMEKIEMPLLPVLAQMELNGIAVDLKLLQKLSEQVTAEIKTVSATIFKLSGTEFNISSPTQLREVLFEKMEIPVEGIKKGKTGLSTSAEQLEKLRGQHLIIEHIENYRELEKLRNTYIDVLPTLINKKTGRIHTTFNQAVAATGRLSSSDPNLQNIPIRTELGRKIRKAFVAEDGNVLISADYSQIELRVVASLAEDKKMMEIFEAGLDIHAATAAAINHVDLKDVTKDMRRAAKEVNFGVLYGMGAYGLAWRADIPQWQAKDFIDKYFSEFSGVKKYLDATLEFTKKEGYCETLFGRRRYIPELNASNHQLRMAGERMAINHPIQGTAADLIKMAMIEISKCKYQNEKLLSDDVRMILQVHDELVFEVKKELADEVGKKVKEIMEGVAKLRVPIVVEVNVSKSWGEMK